MPYPEDIFGLEPDDYKEALAALPDELFALVAERSAVTAFAIEANVGLPTETFQLTEVLKTNTNLVLALLFVRGYLQLAAPTAAVPEVLPDNVLRLFPLEEEG